MATRSTFAFLVSIALAGLPLQAVAQSNAPTEGLLVVYGSAAPSREGDVDRREQIFFSVPAEMSERLFVRIFDPEVSGSSDFTYGGTGNANTTFRLFGGEGAFSQADRPSQVEDGARAPRVNRDPVTGPGEMLREEVYTNDRATDGRWVTLSTLRARQGEIIDGRAYFRIDVQGTGGDDGNGFSVGVSLARDRDRPPEGLAMFAYQPTIRWLKDRPPTRVRFDGSVGGPFTVQSFDAANGTLSVVTDFADLPVRASGQDFWSIDTVETSETNLALSLSGGFETPNDVTVSVFDGSGAPVPLSMPPAKAPDPARPTALATGRPLADCRAVAFDASGSTGRAPLSYLWDFGDGKSATIPVIAHRYDEPGRYVAELQVTEAGTRPGRGQAVSVPVHVRSAPVSVPGDRIVVAPGDAVIFDGTGSVASDSPITRYLWTFGDGNSAEGPTAETRYDQPGSYRAVLRVEDDSDHPCNFGVETREVVVNSQPVAEAGTDQITVVGQPVILAGGASYDVDGSIADYRWDMGDGTALQGDSVTHAFTAPGTYEVRLTVRDDSGVSNDLADDTMLVVVNAPPEPVIGLPSRPVSVSEATQLDASASSDADGEILTYMWDFGDGATGEGETVSYAWTRPGLFDVTLTVTDDSGTASATQQTTLQVVVDAAPVSDAGPDQFVTASDVIFDGGGSTDTDGQITAWEWDFGDGATASGKTVSHAYARPGIYEVALLVRDDSGAPLNQDRDTMQVTVNSVPIADAGPPQTVAPGETFVVNGRASVDPDGAIAEYVWDFPDGSTARGQRASFTLNEPGLHRIGLTVYDDFRGGAASDQSEVLVTVNAPPVAVAGADLLIAPGESVLFDAGHSFDPDGELSSYRWEFDDLGAPLDSAAVERAYETPGVWSAQLVVTDDSGVLNATATDTKTIRVNHPPVAEAGAPIETEVLFVTLDASGSSDADGDALIYRWDFGDGSPPAFGEVVDHAYPRSGVFPVTLRVDDGTGLSNATAIDATTVTIKARPVADAGGNRDVCSGEPILFDASGSLDPDGGLLLYSWDFGDGSGSDLINPTKTYEEPGVYPVTLRIQNETGTSWGSDIDRIAALVREGPLANAGKDMTVCTNQPVRFDGSGSTDADGAVNAFSWTFGDGGTASGERPEYLFKAPGNYAVTLTITGEAMGACSPLDTDVVNVEVVAAPELQIRGAERAAAGLPADFKAQLSDLGGATPIGFDWTFSDGATATGDDVRHTFAEPGEHFIAVTVQLAGGNPGCSTIEVRRKVIVNEAPQPVIEAPDRVATGDAIIFDAASSFDADGAITGFVWAFGDGTTAQGIRAAHRFAEPGDHTVTLSVTDDAGVGNSTVLASKTVMVNPAPRAGLKAPPPVCPAVDVPWSIEASEGTAVSWLFEESRTAEGPSVSHRFAQSGLFPVRATLDDGTGLPNARRSEEVYVRVNSAPTALAGPDRVVCPGDTVTFDAGRSGDLDGQIVEWLWEFSDGVTLSGEQVERAFEQSGPIDVRLTVRDDSGSACSIGTDTAALLVNSTPLVDAGPDLTVPVGAAHDVARFDAGAARDVDGQGLRLSWDFGDGAEASGAVARHSYSTPGTYTVTVMAQDTTGLACGVATDTATVQALPRQ
ncbi:PKD domain-containing protein [Thalassococcus sp. S3]|uniref:PKD domain-containing protein n=1 Tax=Thalassococcus sp. S3 TaxID=2017482 RepID=UPI0013EE7730|nr:PKD domain-containing protein [Thalassococcus sp. S3]